MKRLRRIAWNGLAAVSMALSLLTALAIVPSHSRDISFEFTRHGSRWEIACRSGRLWVDNQPQVRLESAEFDSRTADLRRRTHEVWDPAEWRRSVEEMDRLDRERAAVATLAAGQSVPLLPIVALTAVLPACWSASWLRRNPSKRRQLVRLSATSLAFFCVLLPVSAWIRGADAADVIGVPSTWHFYKAVLGNGGILLQSFRTYKRTQRVQFQISTTQGRSRIATHPIGDPTDIPIPYAQTEYARRRGQDTLGPAPRKWNQLHWRIFATADKTTYQQYAWTQSKPPAHPWISRASMISPVGILGIGNPGVRIEESEVFAGTDVWLPYWFIVAVTSIWPAIVLNVIRKSRRAKRRAASSLCAQCGYDLRATPEKCPECGTVPAKPKGAA
ncbi:MAG TPA: hypothetical protein VH370_26120 [Humisphaera sp.]|nr:hypothetical protein [Humisphaera sp.]